MSQKSRGPKIILVCGGYRFYVNPPTNTFRVRVDNALSAEYRLDDVLAKLLPPGVRDLKELSFHGPTFKIVGVPDIKLTWRIDVVSTFVLSFGDVVCNFSYNDADVFFNWLKSWEQYIGESAEDSGDSENSED